MNIYEIIMNILTKVRKNNMEKIIFIWNGLRLSTS
jgi:sRNA-binding regulator protein Hfq